MKYLLDNNIWLERMLDQERAADVAELLARVPSDQLCMTDFTLHSIGVILHRLKQPQVFVQFVEDVLVDGAVNLLTVPPDEMAKLVGAAEKYKLDFDDAYQFVVATNHNLTLVSLDADFDRAERGRQTPDEVIEILDASIENE